MKLPLHFINNPILHQPTADIPEVTNTTKAFAYNMLDTLRSLRGYGLAANQVGSNLRLAVVHAPNLTSKTLVLINPYIVETSMQTEIAEEGCLSIPGEMFKVKRALWIKLNYLDQFGKKKSVMVKNMLARIIQHEVDHLDGITIIDRSKEI